MRQLNVAIPSAIKNTRCGTKDKIKILKVLIHGSQETIYAVSFF